MSATEKDLLKAALTRAKVARHEKPVFFALVLKGVAEGVLLVDRRKIPPAKAAAAKKQLGGSAVVYGLCYGEEESLVFETPEVPAPGWTTAARKAAHEHAGVVIKPVFRQGRDPAHVSESEDADETGAGPPHPPAQAPAAPGPSAALNKWHQRADLIRPKVQGYTQGDAADVKLLFSQAELHARKGEFDRAYALLDDVEKVVTGVHPAPVAVAHVEPAPTHPPAEEARHWAERRKALEPRLLAALKANRGDVTKLRTVFAFAQEKAHAGEYARALAALHNLEQLLDAAPPQGEAPHAAKPADGRREGAFVDYAKALLDWEKKRKEARAELERFKADILAVYQGEQDQAEVADCVQDLDKALTGLDGLEDALTDALNAGGEQRQALHKEVVRTIVAYQEHLKTSTLLSGLEEDGPFGACKVRAILAEFLDDFAHKLLHS